MLRYQDGHSFLGSGREMGNVRTLRLVSFTLCLLLGHLMQYVEIRALKDVYSHLIQVVSDLDVKLFKPHMSMIILSLILFFLIKDLHLIVLLLL